MTFMFLSASPLQADDDIFGLASTVMHGTLRPAAVARRAKRPSQVGRECMRGRCLMHSLCALKPE